MENFIKTISAIPFFSEQEISLLLSISHSKILKKGSYWTREKHQANQIGFIEEGYLRKYYVKEEKEITDSFYFENSFTADIPSILTHTASLANTIAMEDSRLTCMSYKDLNRLCEQSHPIEHFVRVMIEKTFAQFYYRTVSFIVKSPKERYQDLVNDYPQVLQKAKQYHIASYLGISAQHLSRLRGRP